MSTAVSSSPLAGHEQDIDALREVGAMLWQRGWSVGTSSNYSIVLCREPLELLITASGKDKGRLKQGDFVIMQFGHNDAGPLDDTARARGTLKGIGDDSTEIYNPRRKREETVHTYGWYMRKYVNDARAAGAAGRRP